MKHCACSKCSCKKLTAEFLRLANFYYHINFRSSVCVPSTCNAEEVEKIAMKVMEHIGIEFDVKVPNCEIKKGTITFTTSEIIVLVVLGSILTLGILATIADVSMKLTAKEESYQSSLGVRCLLCFSFYSNTLRLLKKDDSPDSIRIFHGLKVITILWVILNHTYYYLNYQVAASLLNARELGKEIAFQFIANGFLNVETFFFISAVLVAYGVMKMKEEKLNVGLYIFRRFWRLTPPFMLVIACVNLIHHVGSGPVWKETVTQGLTEKCRNYWWTNLLYINNFFPSADMCLQWTWYIPVDTHLYFLSLLVLIPLKKNPKLAFVMNGAIFVVGTTVSAVSNVYHRLHPTAIFVYNHPDDINYFVDRGYFRTYLHCSTYCVGLTVGYILATKKKLHMSMKLVLFGWVSAFVLALCVLYGVYDWNQGNVPGIALSTLYTCTNKFVWSLALGWVTLACMTGYGGIATSILSWGAFVPLGRLTYMAYLVHPIIQFLYIGSTRTLIRTAHRTMLFMYLADVVLAFVVAYFLSLMFESPFMALEKVLFSNPKRKQGSSGNTTEKETRSAPCGEENACAINFTNVESHRL
ncbi:hypothetical protein JTE90_024843 [Oedothorax gibbosus]|uniref:Acyltransferase 3 domain-containing protein n=1 Tax=Oedothorax gibbosus TaxID=931172 RepID=A0AAV6U8R4_9ARAC|nr:hypothetical protein JTE90_024843 [Oedothorax gibbosus]